MNRPDTYTLSMAKTPNPADQEGIRARIRQLIDQKYGGTQGDLAAAVTPRPMQSAAMSNLLSGKKQATAKQLRQIEAASRARFEWLVSGTEPMFHPVGWVPQAGGKVKEGDYLRVFVDEHRDQFTQTRLSEWLGVSKSTVGDYFGTASFDTETKMGLLSALRELTNRPDLSEPDVFGEPHALYVAENWPGYERIRQVRSVGNLSGESVMVLPFVPLRARAGISTARYWEHPPETTRALRSSLLELEADLFLPKKNWWIIEVDGDSMEPQLVSRSRVLAYYVGKEQVADLKPGVWAIQYDDDFVIKRIRGNSLEADKGLLLYSDNPPPDPYFIKADSIRHVWYIEKTIDSKVR
ncbi:S24 family peptidase [Spirosoma spitsbergense]|uniref:S24 family peptidase n=1 Tax=Spirosoma spitsbergense TaxID=431554 RepID=UPI0004770D9C|nr:S24 family peptidase [Spirosoma spitsbergense]